jgi:hypothetical protein
MNSSKPYAEVIESSLRTFVAQCWSFDAVPAFGSLCSIALEETHPRTTVFAVIHQIQTGSTDPTRHITPYQKTHQELREQHPQIFAFLKTTFSCTVLGYAQSSKMHYEVAPRPVPVHSFITPVDFDQGKLFFASLQFVHLLSNATEQMGSIDDVLIALTSQAIEHKFAKSTLVKDMVDHVSVLAKNDYHRLRLFAQRMSAL